MMISLYYAADKIPFNISECEAVLVKPVYLDQACQAVTVIRNWNSPQPVHPYILNPNLLGYNLPELSATLNEVGHWIYTRVECCSRFDSYNTVYTFHSQLELHVFNYLWISVCSGSSEFKILSYWCKGCEVKSHDWQEVIVRPGNMTLNPQLVTSVLYLYFASLAAYLIKIFWQNKKCPVIQDKINQITVHIFWCCRSKIMTRFQLWVF